METGCATAVREGWATRSENAEWPAQLMDCTQPELGRRVAANTVGTLPVAAAMGGDAKGEPPPERLIPPMIDRFIATDREFAKVRRGRQSIASSG